jgi:DNA-binding MarR family transcriptional regulator
MKVTLVSAEQLADELQTFIFTAAKSGQHDAFRLAGEIDMSMSQLRTLFVLDARDAELAVHELAESIGVSMPSAGRAVDQLVRGGLVARREDAHDRRVKRIRITEPGRAALRMFTDAKRERLRQFAAELTDDERNALSDAITPILARLAAPAPAEVDA